MYDSPLVPQRPVAASPVQPRSWSPPRREFGMTEADLLPPTLPQEPIPFPPPPAPPVPVNPMVEAFNRNRPAPFFGLFGGARPEEPPAAALTSAPAEPPAEPSQEPVQAAQTPAQQPPPAAATPPAQPAPTQPQPAPSPVQQALQPAPDPFAPHFQVMQRFEGDGVNPTSGASGFGQVLPSTYADWVTRFGARFPWMPRTLEEYRNAPRELQERVYREIVYPNEYQPALQNAGLEFSPINAAVVNFLGPTGGVRFLQGATQNPAAPGTSLASPQAVEANRNVFFDRDGRERNAGEVLQYIAQGGGRGGGALTAANTGGGTADQRTNAAATAPATTPTPEANPYRDRLLQLLTSIEGERNSRPELGEMLLRMGSGILSGRDLMDGMGRGGTAVAELMQQTRQDNARRDQTLVSGFQGLVNDRRFQQQRTTFGAPTNLRVTMPDGTVDTILSRPIDNLPHVLDPRDNQWKPIEQVYPGARFRADSRNVDDLLEGSWQGIAGARGGSVINGVPVPTFPIGTENERRGYVLGRAAVAATVRLEELEKSGRVDPTTLTAAVDRFVNSQPEGVNRWTFTDQFARWFQQQNGSPLTTEQREYTARMLQFINATGRADSGAQINAGEWGMYRNMFVPRLNDPSGTVEVFQALRREQAASLAASAGLAPSAYLLGSLEGRFRINQGVADAANFDLQRDRSQPQAAQSGGNSQQGGDGASAQRPIAITGAVDTATLDPNKYYRSPGGVVKTGREWQALSAQRRAQ